MSDNTRRSSRHNKGVPPSRYSPYNRAQGNEMSSPRSLNIDIQSDASSEDELNRTIVPPGFSTPHIHQSTNQGVQSMIDGAFQSTTMQPLVDVSPNVEPPPPDPMQNRNLPRTSGLPVSTETRASTSLPHHHVDVVHPNHSSESNGGSDADPGVPDPIDDQSGFSLSNIVSVPPPSDQTDCDMGRSNGLLPPAFLQPPLSLQSFGEQQQSVQQQFIRTTPLAPAMFSDQLSNIRQLQRNIMQLQKDVIEYREMNLTLRSNNESMQRLLERRNLDSSNNIQRTADQRPAPECVLHKSYPRQQRVSESTATTMTAHEPAPVSDPMLRSVPTHPRPQMMSQAAADAQIQSNAPFHGQQAETTLSRYATIGMATQTRSSSSIQPPVEGHPRPAVTHRATTQAGVSTYAAQQQPPSVNVATTHPYTVLNASQMSHSTQPSFPFANANPAYAYVPRANDHIYNSPSRINVQPFPVIASAPEQPIADYYANTYISASATRASTSQSFGSTEMSQPPCHSERPMSDDGRQLLRDAERTVPPIRSYEQRYMPCKRLHDLPKFSGRPEEWPRFICVFQNSTQEHGYTDLDNMERLEKALVGEAKSLVTGIMIRPEHVGKTVEALARAFGRPDILANSQMAEIRKIPKIQDGRLNEMISFSIAVDSLVSFLDGPATRHLLHESILLRELTAKLPPIDQRVWAAVARRIGPNPSIQDFASWLAETAEDISNMKTNSIFDPTPTPRQRDSKPPSKPKGRHVLMNVASRPNDKPTPRCAYCNEVHHIEDCVAFKKLPVQKRLFEVRKRPLCYMCLGSGHLLPGCNLNKRCGINGCVLRHHVLLHDANIQEARAPHPVQNDRESSQPIPAVTSTVAEQPKKKPTPQTPSPQPSTVLSCQGGRPTQSLYYRVVPVVLHGRNTQLQTYALLDEGSSVSLIDSEVANALELEGEIQPLDLQFVSGLSTTQLSRAVSLGISGIDPESEQFRIHTVQTTTDLSLPVQTLDRHDVVSKNPHLADIPFATFHNVRPKILLGLEHHYLGVPLETRTSPQKPQSVVAARTNLGWVLYGSCGSGFRLPGAVVLHARRPDSEIADTEFDRLELLHEMVRQHFTTEDFGVKAPTEPIESDAEKRARRLLKDTTRRVGARFETGLLWRYDEVKLPNSYPMALQRLTSIEAKMRRDSSYAKQYRDQIDAYVGKGYARKMSASEAASSNPLTWYLPHFAVQSASKPGKFRLVFDAAATTYKVSLNSKLLTGPDLNIPLTRLLFRFRLGTIGVCADVKEMFHQVLVRKKDQDAQRFLWRDGDASVEPSVYVMVAMTFGSTCSPTSAQYVKNVNAQEFAEEFPEAADAVQRNHYVDDYVASFRTSEEAQRITADVIEVHRRGGFELRGVVSNCEAVRSRFGTNHSNRSVCLEPEDLTQKILGMTWETEDDCFVFQTRFHRVNADVINGTRTPTKREVLSFIMSIFDPFGLLAEFLLPAKTMMQDMWRIGVDWDEPVPEEINARWQAWRAQVEHIRQVRIARCYSKSIFEASVQLHMFADASEEAFSAVGYWRVETPDGVDLAFVAGKVKCAPMKILSIPRLELQAAVLATRLMTEIKRSHEGLNITETVLWSDSETVLKWLRCDQRRYVSFVGHRVAEVVENAPANWWRWVPTALNPADDATRTKTPVEFNPRSRWLYGPSWLKMSERSWPEQPSFTDPSTAPTHELKPKFVGGTFQRGAVEFSRFSKLMRLLRCIAWVRRFIHNARSKGDQKTTEINATEIDQSAEEVCRVVQMEAYGEEIRKLRSGEPICSKSRLFLLRPYLDADGLLRLQGRTDAAQEEFLSSAAKRPIIMPPDHYVTTLIVRHYHEHLAHQLTDATIAAVRGKYWVPRLRTLVKSVRKACQTCRIRAAKPNPPMQGQLPPDRLNAYARPFTTTGLDFFGPYQVTVGRRREKRWVALFTCMAIRAVHLEVAADLTTDACLVCLRNFCHLRGVPAVIRCDNGTNFVGAKRELEREKTFFDPEAIQRELSVQGVEWKFNCPSNPEAGGAWERLVQCVKRVLAVTLHEEAPRVETFRALLLEAANIINSRPLTHLQIEPDDPEPLTPNHLLIGGPNVATVPNPADVEPKATRRQWQICRGLSRRFWMQFVREYVPELTRSSRHYPVQPPLQEGDVVFICDENLARSKWTRGIVIAVCEGKDGVVRTATVRTANGEYRRPVTRLAKIDVGPSGGIDVRGAVSLISTGP